MRSSRIRHFNGSPAPTTLLQPASSATATAATTDGDLTETPGDDESIDSLTNREAHPRGVALGVAVVVGLIVSWFILKRRRQRRVHQAQFDLPGSTEMKLIMTDGMAEVDPVVKAPHNGRWELSGQHDRPEAPNNLQQRVYELE
ncbi:hypothetical protein LTR84_010784 [Exophiala bonariae]|uniref:Uncharacterized protein n=1 Tax=Exophiala bonariae TaxID=1690606 RepID=A0AAV9NHS7_9EURO|nr:hypothetical protein LTR84_010784 [Exophiala bonariae]